MEVFTRLKKLTSPRASNRLSRQDFGLLKLPDREASIDAIRNAAILRVKDARRRPVRDSDVAVILTAAYRLLDPRRRQRVSERVQLSLPAWEAVAVEVPPPALLPPRGPAPAVADDLNSEPTLDELRQILLMVRAAEESPASPRTSSP